MFVCVFIFIDSKNHSNSVLFGSSVLQMTALYLHKRFFFCYCYYSILNQNQTGYLFTQLLLYQPAKRNVNVNCLRVVLHNSNQLL
jgi:hypothetical protein